MFNIEVDLYRQSGMWTKEETYLVGDDRSLRCLSLLREDEEYPNDEGKEDGDDWLLWHFDIDDEGGREE
jgi:hypothetical protein